jgi:16S rRNA processing protein RimM
MAAEETKSDSQSNSAQQPPEFLVVGRIVRPHGIRGILIVEPQSKFIMDIRPGTVIYLGSNRDPVSVLQFSPHRKRYLLKILSSNSREDADMYRDKMVHLRFEDTEPIPDGDYYDWQLLGMNVITDDGETLGMLAEIIETGANDVYLVRADSDEEILLPAIESVIKIVNLDDNTMVVHLIPGLLPDS